MTWSLSNTLAVQAVELHHRQHGSLRQLPRRPPEVERDAAARPGRTRRRPATTSRRTPASTADSSSRTTATAILKAPDEGYDAADFALCFVCHAEAPFRSGTSTNSVFDDHDLHVSVDASEGPGGTDIDTPGQGGGNAICAECHFRIHGTALALQRG